MKETTLSNDQLSQVPQSAVDAKAFRLSSFHSIKQLERFCRANKDIILASSCGSAVILTHVNPIDRYRRPKLKVRPLGGFGGQIYAASDTRDAMNMILELSQIPGHYELAIERCDTIQGRHEDLEVTDAEAIFTNCYPAAVEFAGFRLSREYFLALARLERPISIRIAPPFMPEMGPFLEALLSNHHRTTFGKLNLLNSKATRYLVTQDLVTLLAPRDTVLFDELLVSWNAVPSEVLLKLFDCRRSIRRLGFTHYSRNDDGTDHASILSTLEHKIANDSFPRSLYFRTYSSTGHNLPVKRILRALSSPGCRLEEINYVRLFDNKEDKFALALGQNKSLKRIHFDRANELVSSSDKVLQSIVAHPTIEILHVSESHLVSVHPRFGHWQRNVIPLLKRKRQLKIEIGSLGNCGLEKLIEPAMSFNRFHSGVADALPRRPRRTFYTSLALLHCFRDIERTAVLLHENFCPLGEILSQHFCKGSIHG